MVEIAVVVVVVMAMMFFVVEGQGQVKASKRDASAGYYVRS